MKIVYKPWGKEEWLEQNEFYCYKRIYINKGYRTSYQYHNEKVETNYIISGKAEVWLENDNGVVEILQLKEGDFFNVKPPRKHRVIAKTDIILQEVSTPQVDDVIRISDDTHRIDGKIINEHLKPAFCIVSSGKGTRMSHLTENINKALLPINGKAVISHIIDKVPKDYDIIITTGYKAELLKEYCEAAHGDRHITYVNVPDYDSDGNGPGTSLLRCKQLLQRSFYFSTVDCLIEDNLPHIDCDWIGVSPTSIPEIYATAELDENLNVINLKNKSKNGYEYAYIGLSAIYDYEKFWNTLLNKIGKTGELVSVYISDYKVSAKIIDWYDTGTIDSYNNIKQLMEENYFALNKGDEYFYEIGNKIIKMFIDSETCKNRIKRAEILKNYIPKLTYKGNNVYAYEKFEGYTLYEADTFNLLKEFLNYLKSFWKIDHVDIKEDAKLFYHDKTYKRINKFVEKYPNIDLLEHNIDGVQCESLNYYLHKIDWESLENCLPSKNFHGDLQFDNVLFNGDLENSDGEFKLIDWRQSFGNSTEYGDIYYDLAKLYGGLLISYYDMKKNNFSFDDIDGKIKLNYEPSKNLKSFKTYYENWIVDNGYDLNKVKTLTFIIYLNMSPLHEKPFDLFLFYFAKKLIQTNEY
jgi:NDP-sugar pyrophosphorylase family protein/mannose-6-phosphate isomerase-like protein (cupin superfamily)